MITIESILREHIGNYVTADEYEQSVQEAKQALSTMVEEIIHTAKLNDSIYQRQLELAADRGFTIDKDTV